MPALKEVKNKAIAKDKNGPVNIFIKGLSKHYPEMLIKEINGDGDHVHLLISIPPQWSVGEAVRIIKANTARVLNERFPFLLKGLMI